MERQRARARPIEDLERGFGSDPADEAFISNGFTDYIML